jgi:hypothetical protein
MLRSLLLIAIVVGTASTSLAAPTTREARIPLAQQRWEQRLARAGGQPIPAPYYPTEEALVFLTAYDFTRDARYAGQAARQLDYCHSRERDGLLLTGADDTTTRDYQARQIYNFYLAYRILGDGKYLRRADGGAQAMLRAIPRSKHECRGEVHLLFEAGFFTADGKPALENGNVIDVNQNAEIALAFSLLYHDPASAFFRSGVAKEIAYEELLASMSVQDRTTGTIPLTENIPGGDTAYGSYAAFSWVWCQLLWNDPRFEPHVRAAGKWLGPMMNLARDTQRYYPTRIDGGPVPDWEAYYRLPLLWYCGVDTRGFVADLFERLHQDATTAPLYWAYFDLMGIPRELFIDGRNARRTSPPDR